MKYHDPFQPDTFYHVFNHAVGHELLFRTADNYIYFLQKYRQYMQPVWDTYAYCLMPNHFHLLIKIKSLSELVQYSNFKEDIHQLVMQPFSNFLNGYAKAYNRKFERRGALLEDFTKRVAVTNKQYLINLINYIHQNPVHHGFCHNIEEWIFSSYHAFLSEKETQVRRAEVLNLFGDVQHFKLLHIDHLMPLREEWEFV